MGEALLHHRKGGLVRSVHPHRFALWLGILSIIMLFISLSSAYIVKKAEGDWLLFEFPSLFIASTGIILISSVTMHWAYHSARKDNISNVKTGLLLTIALCIGFAITQYLSWGQLVAQDVFFVGNPSGSFIYVFTGLHLLHLVGGMVFLGITLSSAWRYRVHSRSTLLIEMCTSYWHFLGGLWLYLYLFLIANN